MARDPKAEAALALHRFGFGPTPGAIDAIASDPRGALLAELERPGAALVGVELKTSPEISRGVFEDNAQRAAQIKLDRKRREAEQKQADATMQPAEPAMADAAAPPPQPVPYQRRVFQEEALARLDAAVKADIGFAQRLVWFWSNHLCVSADKVPATAGPYEREAIRAHALGRFADMLQAAESHPAMLFYLDNFQSLGANSIAGINRDRGLNENLAREILELHTLGVRTGYSQDDVTSFAKVITGWTIVAPRGDPEHGGEFVFNKLLHEPGPQTVLGKVYPDGGVAQGRAVLADLAAHPATARHLAEKFARHFVADQPPSSLVDRLAQRFLASDGDLKEMAVTLVTAPEAWDPARTKLKRPGEWVVGALRATGAMPAIQRVLQAQNLLGEPQWRPPAPNGFSDDSAAWTDGLAQRLDVANTFARRIAERLEPQDMIDSVLGPLASAETRQTIARAESREQALALLLMSPEFQRR